MGPPIGMSGCCEYSNQNVYSFRIILAFKILAIHLYLIKTRKYKGNTCKFYHHRYVA